MVTGTLKATVKVSLSVSTTVPESGEAIEIARGTMFTASVDWYVVDWPSASVTLPQIV